MVGEKFNVVEVVYEYECIQWWWWLGGGGMFGLGAML